VLIEEVPDAIFDAVDVFRAESSDQSVDQRLSFLRVRILCGVRAGFAMKAMRAIRDTRKMPFKKVPFKTEKFPRLFGCLILGWRYVSITVAVASPGYSKGPFP